MPAAGITVLKHNVPWGPFTRVQVDEGLARGDFSRETLAHAPGLSDWKPLRDVLDFVDGVQPLPPVPAVRDYPPIPVADPVPVRVPQPLSSAPFRFADPVQPAAASVPPPSSVPVKPPASKPVAPPLPSARVVPPVSTAVPGPAAKTVPPPDSTPLKPASFFLRVIAFLVDCGILFLPLLLLYVVGALCIEIPDAIRHVNHESRMESWELLDRNTRNLAWLIAIGFGWLYGAGLESSPRQATVGKRWMGLKVTDGQGRRLTFLRATGRYAAKYLSALPCFLGFMLALFGSQGRALHDRLADTRVVST
jgi:uncharacterized RDD family membrane protein YckC